MTQDVDVRSVPLPGTTYEAVKRLARRTLELDAAGGHLEAERFMTALFGSGAALFGHLHGFSTDDIRAANAQVGLEDPPVADVKELAGLFRAIVPETPVCPDCMEFALSNAGGKISTLPAGATCPFCKSRRVAVVPTILRMLRWTDGALIEPQATHDLRKGEPVPIQDAHILRGFGERISSTLERILRQEDVPIYAFLAYAHLTLRRLGGDLSKAADLLRRPRDFGFGSDEELRTAAKDARRFVRAREIAVGIPDDAAAVDDGFPRLAIAGRTYAVEGRIGTGENADVYRARWDDPLTELVVIKLCREDGDRDALAREADVLRRLQRSEENGSHLFTRLIPEPVAFARVAGGLDRPALVVRDKNLFDWTLADVLREYPEGVEPQTMVWMWNRLLMLLAWTHLNEVAHADIRPEHVLIHPRNHGATLIGWSKATSFGEPLGDGTIASPTTDIAASARCMIAVLGGAPADGALPKAVAEPLADLLRVHAGLPGAARRIDDALKLQKAFSKAAEQAYGPRRYHPFHLPRRPK